MKEDWKYKRLGEVCDIYQPKTIASSQLIEDGKYPVFGANGMIGRYNDYNHEEAEVLLCCRGATCGAINMSLPFSWINGNAMVIRPKAETYLKSFLRYLLLSLDYTNVITGTAQPQITRTTLSPILVPIPSSISEQQSIVEYLDSSFAKIDAMKANAEKSLNEAKALFQSSLKSLLEPKVGWEEKTLKQIGKTQTGTTPSKADKSFYGGDIPFIRPAELNVDGNGAVEYDSALKLTQNGADNSRLITANSILMCCIGSVGKMGYTIKDVTCNQQINTLSPSAGYVGKFVYYALLAPSFQNEVIKIANSAKATLAIISKGKWETLCIPVPPFQEQQDIAATLDNISFTVARLQTNYDKISKECDALKQALLKQVFE